MIDPTIETTNGIMEGMSNKARAKLIGIPLSQEELTIVTHRAAKRLVVVWIVPVRKEGRVAIGGTACHVDPMNNGIVNPDPIAPRGLSKTLEWEILKMTLTDELQTTLRSGSDRRKDVQKRSGGRIG